MSKAVYPGAFDPVTRGHLDVIERASRIFDRLVVAVGDNPAKDPVFTGAERLAMVRAETAGMPNVEVASFKGLLVDFCKARRIRVVVRGIRTVSEFEHELQMAFTNRSVGGIETIFVAPRPEYTFLSARLLKEVARMGGDVASMVTPRVAAKLVARMRRKESGK